MNSDDTYEPGAIREAVEFMQHNPQAIMIYGDAHYLDENDRGDRGVPAAQTDLKRLRSGYVHIPQQASFFTAAGWKAVAPLDPTFYFAMDYDLWVRLAQLGPILYHPRVWANFRLHRDAKTMAADDRCWPEMLGCIIATGDRGSRDCLEVVGEKVGRPVYSLETEKIISRKRMNTMRDVNFLKELIFKFRLTVMLVLDKRVAIYLKLIPLAAVVYLVVPFDLMIGPIDDAAVIMGAMQLFISLCPKEVCGRTFPGIAQAERFHETCNGQDHRQPGR